MRQSNALALLFAGALFGACGKTPAPTESTKATPKAAPTGSASAHDDADLPAKTAGAASSSPTNRVARKSELGASSSRARTDGGPSPLGAAAPLRGGPSVDCYDRFVPSGTPHVDVLRLGVSCGPSNGLTLIGKMSGNVDEAHSFAHYQWEAERRDCFRVFAAAAEPVEDLEVEIVFVAPHAERVSLTNQNRRWAVVDEDGPFCAAHAGTYEARFSTHAGHGAVAASIWKGARMGPARGRL